MYIYIIGYYGFCKNETLKNHHFKVNNQVQQSKNIKFHQILTKLVQILNYWNLMHYFLLFFKNVHAIFSFVNKFKEQLVHGYECAITLISLNLSKNNLVILLTYLLLIQFTFIIIGGKWDFKFYYQQSITLNLLA